MYTIDTIVTFNQPDADPYIGTLSGTYDSPRAAERLIEQQMSAYLRQDSEDIAGRRWFVVDSTGRPVRSIGYQN